MSALEITLLLLSAAVLGVVLFRFLHLPPVLGYLSVGILIGPHALGFIQSNETTHLLAEFGIVFLMFSIGLEFSLRDLLSMRRTIFGLGSLQVICCTLLSLLGSLLLGMLWLPSLSANWKLGLTLGLVFAMSSTAIVIKMLTERLELNSSHGRTIFGILLFQDLAVVPAMILLPALANTGTNMLLAIGFGIAKAAAVLVVLLFFGRKLMGRWLNVVAQRGSQELFMLNLLLMTLGAAWLTELAGLPLALGAFIAGLLISETTYKHVVEADIQSFRDVLLGLFFITVGMLLDVKVLMAEWPFILMLVLTLILLKIILITGLARLFKNSFGDSLRVGLILAQGGEFGFVLINQANQLQLINGPGLQVVLAALILSMLAAPFIILRTEWLVFKLSANEWMMQSLKLTQIAARNLGVEKHVIIAGFGRTGQNLVGFLNEENIHYHALDLDPTRIRNAQAAGMHVSYGDATRPASLMAAGIKRAAALVITYNNTTSALKVVHFVRQLAPELPIIVRTLDEVEFEKFRKAGANGVVPETIEASMMLASHTLVAMGVPLRRVVRRIQTLRDQQYAGLRSYFHGTDDSEDYEDVDENSLQLQTLIIHPAMFACGKKIAELEFLKQGIELISIQRAQKTVLPDPDVTLAADDVLVLRGILSAFEKIKDYLRQGSN